MSKLWLLLLLVAAFQNINAYPAEYEIDDDDYGYMSEEAEEDLEYYTSTEDDDYMSDEQSTWGILTDAWGKLKDKYSKITAAKLKKIIVSIKNKFCTQQEDFEDDLQSDEAQDSLSIQYKIVQNIRERYKAAKAKWGNKKEKFNEALAKIKAEFCGKLKDYAEESDFYEDDDDGDEERFNWGSITKGLKKAGQTMAKGMKTAGKSMAKGLKTAGKNVAKGMKTAGKNMAKGMKTAGKSMVKGLKTAAKKLKKLKEPMKKLMKKGATLLKNAGIKIRPLQCEEKTCQSCIVLTIPTEISFCVKMTFMKTNKATYLIIHLTKNDEVLLEKKLIIGEVPHCVYAGSLIGDICLKGIEGHAKSSKGQLNANICLVIVTPNWGIASKLCAVYEDKKLRVKFEPTAFPAVKDEDGEIVEMTENGEEGAAVDADEEEVEVD
uniref:Venom redulysin 7 n=1 Tax=Oncocephalus sp. TaxID=2944721 RepID=A0AB38ZEG6_9HEMI